MPQTHPASPRPPAPQGRGGGSAAQALLADTLDASGIGLVQVNLATRSVHSFNATFCALSGYTPEALRGLDIARLNHPEEPLDAPAFARLLAGRAPLGRERRLVRRDGTIIWIQVSGHVLRDAGGRPLRGVGIVQDITARRQAQEALREREAHLAFVMRLNDALRRIDDPVALIQQACRMLGEFVGADRVGYAEDEGDGQSVSVTHHHSAGVADIPGRYRYDDYGPALLKALRAGQTVVRPDIARDPSLTDAEKAAHASLQLGSTVNVPLLKAGQLHVIFFVHTRAARTWSGAEVALFQDVAERLRADLERSRAEAALRSTQSWLAAALRSMSDAVLIVDARGSVREFNDAYVRLFRLGSQVDSPRDAQGWRRLMALHAPDGSVVPADARPVQRALAGHTGIGQEFILVRRRGGARRSVLVNFAPIRDDSAAIIGAVVTARDVTGLKRMHADLERAHAELQRLVSAQDRAREDERARIAQELHDDMQQILAAIMLDAAAARVSLGAARPRVQEALVRIEDQAGRAIDSTRRIIRDLHPRELHELGLVGALETLVARFARSFGIGCTVEARGAATEAEGLSLTETTALFRVAQEALNNVAKHAHAHAVRVTLASRAGGGLRLRIADDGMGLAAGPPRRANALGVAGMRERVRAIGGTLRLSSRSGQGTVVDVTIPRSTPAREPG